MSALTPALLATVAPALPLLILALALRPKAGPAPVPHPAVRCGCCPAHRAGVPVSRTTRRLAQEYARRPRPVGYQSPAWTVQPREVA